MGILSDLLATANTFGVGDTRSAGDRVTKRQLNDILREHGDFDYPSGYDAVNEVQNIAIFGGSPSAGTFTLTFTLKSGETFTTAAIAYDANATTIRTAINVAATAASIVGWTNADIAITGGPLTTTPLVITFSGNSVKALNHSQTTINAGSVTGGTAGAATTSTQGHTARAAWAFLKVCGIVTSAPPAQASDLTGPTIGLGRGQFPYKLDNDTVKDARRRSVR
jgi:hypothetical protein